MIAVAREAHEIEWLIDGAEEAAKVGDEAVWLDRDADAGRGRLAHLRRRPVGARRPALVDPARLAWELRRVALELGARLHEHSAVTHLRDDGALVLAETAHGHVRARRCVLATNAYPPLLRRIGAYVVPVYDYVLMTEPLTDEQRASIGWRRPPGPRRLHEPVPLLPPDRRRPDPVGRLRRRLPLPQRLRPVVRAARRPPTSCWRGSSSRRSRSSPGACGSATGGAARSTPAAASASSSAPRTAARRRTPPATRGSASAPPASAPGWPSTCCRRPRDRGHADGVRAVEAGAVPARAAALRRHHADAPRAGPAPTATAAGAACGCGRSTGSGSASTPRDLPFVVAQQRRRLAARVEPVDLHLGPADHEVGVHAGDGSGPPRSAPRPSARPRRRRPRRTRRP